MAEVHRVALADGSSLYVEELGRGRAPAVVFGHSLLCDGRMFMDQVAGLAQDHHVINVDLRGHGRSDAPRRRYTIEDQAGDYLRVMDALGVGSAVLVGLSMGGMAAVHAALAAPERVTGLVLLNTSAGAEGRSKRLEHAVLAKAARALGVRRWMARQSTAILFGATFRRNSPEVVSLWEDRMMALDRGAVHHAVQMLSSRPSVVARLPEIAAPTLVVVGDEDVATPPACARTIAQGIRGARLEVLPGTGHLSTIEEPAETTRLIRDFIGGLSARGPSQTRA